ncbi:hypothetical protein MRB53_037567 [Persea americana]|nr:hypothetical protein MRB53_037567 [Persea americana]
MNPRLHLFRVMPRAMSATPPSVLCAGSKCARDGTKTLIRYGTAYISLLRDRPTASPVPSYAPTGALSETQSQASLHNFWSLPAISPRYTRVGGLVQYGTTTSQCEDCDCEIESESEDLMDIDYASSSAAHHHACRFCSRTICNLCSTDRGGRSCLDCAMQGRGNG